MHTFTLASFGDLHFRATLNCKMTSCESCASSCSKNKGQPRQSTLLLDFWWTDRKDQRTKITQNWSFFNPVISSGIWKPSKQSTKCQRQGPVHPFLLSRTSKASCEVPELNKLEHFMTLTLEDHRCRCGEHFAHQKAWVTNLQACSLNI